MTEFEKLEKFQSIVKSLMTNIPLMTIQDQKRSSCFLFVVTLYKQKL